MSRQGTLLFLLALLFVSSCAAPRPSGSVAVVPKTPDYFLRWPDTTETRFDEVLRHYNGFERANNSVDLRPWMELRIENAYYRPGMPKRGLNGYLGTETAQYRLEPKGGLHLLSVRSMANRPKDQLPVQQLITSAQRRHRRYRFYYEILFHQNGQTHGSVLIGANSQAEMDQLSSQLIAEPGSFCKTHTANCTIFPEACSVSLEMEIVVNGLPRSVLWGSPLSSIVSHPQRLQLLRLYHGHLVRVAVNPNDPQALRLPLLPGDRLTWKTASF